MHLMPLAAWLAVLAAALISATPTPQQATSCSRVSPQRDKEQPGVWGNVIVDYWARTTSSVKQRFVRTSDVYLPLDYHNNHDSSILLVLHSSHSSGGKEFSINNDLVTLADKHNAVLVAPTGGVKYNDDARPGYTWNVSFVPPQDSEQVNATASLGAYDWPFIQALLVEVQSWPRVDRHKTAVYGHSGGGRFASSLACNSQVSKLLGAIAATSSLRAGPGDPLAQPPFSEVLTDRSPVTQAEPCSPSHPLGILAFHGTNDRTNPYNGNTREQWTYTIPKAMARWSSLLDCDATPTNSTLLESPNITKQTWSCATGAGLQLYLVDGMGHAIPKDDAASPVGANFHWQEKMWDFFQNYRAL